MSLKNFIEEIESKYPDQVNCGLPARKIDEQIPEAVKPIYLFADGIDLPFGRIFPMCEAIEKSGRDPFNPGWFVFGFDNYFTFWLCKKNGSDSDLVFTYWDHESGNSIEDPEWSNLNDFLKDLLEDYEH